MLSSLTAFIVCYGTGRFLSFTGFTFCWVLNFILMAWYTLISHKLNLKLNSPYFEEKLWEKNGKIYRYFGVDVYRKLLVWAGWEKIVRSKNKFERNLSSIKEIELKTRDSELGHLVIAIIVFITAFLTANSLWEARWFIITNLLLNIYPIMLQRYNRPRLRRFIGHFQS